MGIGADGDAGGFGGESGSAAANEGANSSSGGGGSEAQNAAIDAALSGFFGEIDNATTGNEATDAMIDDALSGFFDDVDNPTSSGNMSMTAKIGGVIAGLLSAAVTGSLSLGVTVGRLAAMGLQRVDAQALVDKVSVGAVTPEQATSAATAAISGDGSALTSLGISGGSEGGAYSANILSDAASVASSVAATAPVSEEELQREWLNTNRSDILSAIEQGTMDIDTGINQALASLSPYANLDALNREAAILEDPTLILDDPSFQFKLNQKLSDVNNAFSVVSGGGVTGNMLIATEEETQGLASTELNAAITRLQPFINLSNQARTAMANVDTQGAQAKANTKVGGVTQLAGITNSAAGNMANSINSGANLQANSIIAGANQDVNRISDITNAATQLSQLFV